MTNIPEERIEYAVIDECLAHPLLAQRISVEAARAEEREACIAALRTLWDAGDWLNHNCMECGITFKMAAAMIRERA